MTLIQGYLFRQIGRPVLAACAALAGIGILSQSLDQLEFIVERGQSVWVMVKLTLLALPQLLAVIMPIGLFVGALIALTRLQREQELTAVFASGVTRWQAIRPAVKLALIATLLTLFITTVAQPWAQRAARDETFAVRTDLAALLVEEGKFVQGPEGSDRLCPADRTERPVEEPVRLCAGRRQDHDLGRRRGPVQPDRRRQPYLTMLNGSWQRYSSRGVLEYLSFGRQDLLAVALRRCERHRPLQAVRSLSAAVVQPVTAAIWRRSARRVN